MGFGIEGKLIKRVFKIKQKSTAIKYNIMCSFDWLETAGSLQKAK